MSSFSCQPFLDKLTHILDKARLLENFKCLNCLEEKIRFCFSNKKVIYDENIVFNVRDQIVCWLETLYKVPDIHGKSEEHGADCKAKGSKAYLKKKDIEAHKLYTDGLRFTPANSKYLPLLYANRSAALFQINRYEECLLDIERAMATGYPIESQNKLIKRKVESLIKLGLKNEARECLRMTKETYKDVSLETQEAISFSKTIESMEDKLRKMNISNLKKKSDDSQEIEYSLFAGESRTVSQMSAALELKENISEGRHIKANTNIPKGSVVFRERPFASILLPEYFLTHCQNCYVAVFNPIPCDSCSDIIWCSASCKSEGAIYHKYECNILHILTGVGIAHLALRIVLVAGWQTCFMTRKQFQTARDIPPEVFKFNDKKSRYQAVYSLLTHLNEAAAEDQFQYALAAIILGKAVLERTSFSSDQILNDDLISDHDSLIEIGCIIMHHISQLVSNAHAITQVDEGSETDDVAHIYNVEQKRIASAIYPSASLMNHSCLPAIINSFHKDFLIIHTIREIKSGMQVYNCYGPHAYRQDREERQATLSRQYYFECKCPPCTLDEFLFKEISWNGLICPDCGGIASWNESLKSNDNGLMRCLKCQFHKAPSMDIVNKCSAANQLFQEGEDAFAKGDLVNAEKNLLDALQIGMKVYVSNNYFLNTIRDTLAKILAAREKYNESLAYLLLCIENVKSRYGEDSIEVAHEFLKYLDIASLLPNQEQRKMETDNIRKKVEEIFSTHYGPFWKKQLQIKPY